MQYNIPNLRFINDWLLRGGQPTDADIAQLSSQGVRTVVSLRIGSKTAQNERAVVEAAQMNFVHIPINYLRLPEESAVDQFLALLDDPVNHPVFVHCFHGVDRTGYLIAAYRISRMGWTFQKAYDEMKQCGFHRFRLRHFKWSLWNYARRANRGKSQGNQPDDLSVKQS